MRNRGKKIVPASNFWLAHLMIISEKYIFKNNILEIHFKNQRNTGGNNSSFRVRNCRALWPAGLITLSGKYSAQYLRNTLLEYKKYRPRTCPGFQVSNCWALAGGWLDDNISEIHFAGSEKYKYKKYRPNATFASG